MSPDDFKICLPISCQSRAKYRCDLSRCHVFFIHNIFIDIFSMSLVTVLKIHLFVPSSKTMYTLFFSIKVDPNVHKEFLTWKSNPRLDKEDPFIARIYEEDIRLTLTFNNVELSERVLLAAESGTIFIEAVSDKTKTMFPK